NDQHPSGQSNAVVGDSRVAACAPATGLRNLEWNNVKALIETGGSMWQDRANSRAAYEIPKGGGVSSIYAGALWMGGISPDQQLKLAAVTFRSAGNDYWPGPLTNDGSASVTEATCTQYDRFFVSLRQDAQRHRQYYDCVQAGDDDCIENYSIPGYFYNYPAIGNTALGQDLYLAPFYDYDGDLFYDPQKGDYPFYDFYREINCAERQREDVVPLYGDQTYYWIFNDKGNAHTESQGNAIGMEIRAQAFAFTSNDEVNNMTFYNYVLINQGTQELTQTYFGSWVDSDLGSSIDDYVGCDVQRGLGYCYNGDAFDEPSASSKGYGNNPPAVGVDFFEGPYQDEDGLDNPLTTDILQAQDSLGIPYKGLGIGYGDGIVDNERFGMRRFVYYNIGDNPINGDPKVAPHYYNFMRGKWKNDQSMLYGGNGISGPGVIQGVFADYMFPGDTDPAHWGTNGTVVPAWSEESSGNQKGDRRFIQAAGPFTLSPGDYNNITVGVVWARSGGGVPFESVRLLREYDDKAQALFDNCFELVSGPDAPDVTVQELNREIILMLSNDNEISTNYQENYGPDQGGFDPGIPEELSDGTDLTIEDRSYKFEGYLVYQLASGQVSSNDLGDISKARLIAQCDIKNGVKNIINYNRDPDIGLIVPELKVTGSDLGIRRSFRITTDAFAQGSTSLINHKTYYYMVLAYGYNNYLPYSVALESGQDEAFLASRKAAIGAIPVISAIPHIPSPEAGGTTANSNYGDGIVLTRLEGKGNGMNDLLITPHSEADILANNKTPNLSYLPNKGPVSIKVVDPLQVPAADFELRLTGTTGQTAADSLHWELTNLTDETSYSTYKSFKVLSEDVIVDWGISVSWGQYEYRDATGGIMRSFTDLISASIEFDDPSKPWLDGVYDGEGFSEQNWIRSGSVKTEGEGPEADLERLYDDFEQGDAGNSHPFTDEGEIYEGLLGGTWSPYCLVSYTTVNPSDNSIIVNNVAPTDDKLKGDLDQLDSKRLSNIKGLNNVDIVFTSDKIKWTRVPVLEMEAVGGLAQDVDGISSVNPTKMKVRRHPSVDKNGRKAGDPGYNAAEGDMTGPIGMGWFPGYAIDVGNGERLNMAFGEDSWLAGENGNDMIWNPSSRVYSQIGFQPLFGGQHWIYVFKNLSYEDDNGSTLMPVYDNGQFLHDKLADPGLSTSNWKRVFRACTWVGSSLLNKDYQLLSPENGLIPNDVRVRLRVAKPYSNYGYNVMDPSQPAGSQNNWRNLYTFSTKGLEATTHNTTTLNEVLDIINVVPNPYYAFSTYENNKLDNRVKIVNLPEQCTVTIYDLNGTLIRQFEKADKMTSLDWDLKNRKNIPIGSGTYIIHINVPGAGEKILKWFGVMRPIDLDNF
ncbi:MAG: T9SS type A sorting domain-containing protein, partial [Crocinitomicaceae bacterium]|nr:T9SS type A sorting domain-containing protein [Crocinitomicaceae bacterium]